MSLMMIDDKRYDEFFRRTSIGTLSWVARPIKFSFCPQLKLLVGQADLDHWFVIDFVSGFAVASLHEHYQGAIQDARRKLKDNWQRKYYQARRKLWKEKGRQIANKPDTWVEPEKMLP